MTTETTNGRVKGRTVAPRPTITLAGVPVRLHRASPTTMRDLRAQVWREWAASDDPAQREPQPPTVAPVAADGVEVDLTPEPNHADPDYAKARADWEARRAQAVEDRLFDYFALDVIEVETVDDEAVAHYRRARRRFGLAVRWDGPEYAHLDPEDRERLVYVAGVLLDSCTPEEARAFNAWAYRGTLPTEQEVADALGTFRPAVAGAAAADRGAAPADQQPDAADG